MFPLGPVGTIIALLFVLGVPAGLYLWALWESKKPNDWDDS